MTRETKEMTIGLDACDTNTKLALQCAPVIAGLKVSNLFRVDYSELKAIAEMFSGTSIKMFVLCRSGDSVFLLLYRKGELSGYLDREEVRDLLGDMGYDEKDLFGILRSVSKNYGDYRRGIREFPHELGLILGFPPEDVRGFIENGGRNFRLSGYWKVYGDPDKASAVFSAFDSVKEAAVRLLSESRSLLELLDAGVDGALQYS